MKLSLGRWLPPPPLIIPAIVSGLFVTISFPNVNAWPLVFVALVPLFVALLRNAPGRKDSFKAGYLFGITCFASMLWWIAQLIPSADMSVPGLMIPAVVFLSLYLGLYPACFCWMSGLIARYRLLYFCLLTPALWLLLDAIRMQTSLAFPWGILGYALSYKPILIQSASLWGVHGLTFLIILVNALISGAIISRKTRGRIAYGSTAVVILALMFTHGKSQLQGADSLTGEPVRVALMQPNVDLEIKWKKEFRDSTFRLIDRMAHEAAAEDVDFIVFPETCAPIYIESAPEYKNQLSRLASTLNLPLYIGFLDHRYDGPDKALNIFNSTAVFSPDGTIDKYEKNHLLPFGEALPFSSRLRWLRKLEFGQANFEQGKRRGPVSAGKVSFTPLICFESVFAEPCRDGVRSGSELFVNITNDGWFADTAGPYQHAQMSILRAVEFRRYLVRSANTGISLVVSPTGEVQQKLGTFRPGMIVADVAALTGLTFYARHGDWPLLVFSLLLFVVVLVLARRAA